jgi:hypothetical protein
VQNYLAYTCKKYVDNAAYVNVKRDLSKQTNKLRGLSPQANYTDRATAAYRRSWCQLFADRVCRVVSATDTHGRILGFLDRSR